MEDGGYRHAVVDGAVIDGLAGSASTAPFPYALGGAHAGKHFHQHEDYTRFFADHLLGKGKAVARACADVLVGAGDGMARRTKIVATVGPASGSPATLRGLLDVGTDVVRLGLAHGPIDASIEMVGRVRAASADVDRAIGILVDLPGPKVRTAPFGEDGVSSRWDPRSYWSRRKHGDRSTAERVAIELPSAVDLLAPGDRVALGDGGITLEVEEGAAAGVRARVRSAAVARGRPGVALPEDRVAAVADRRDLVMLDRLLEVGVDAVAVSFVQSADDIVTTRRAIGPDGPMIVAKIETARAVAEVDDIVRVADGVMVARGDLGVRLPLEDVPTSRRRSSAAPSSTASP